MGGNHTHKALSQSVVKIYCFSLLEFISRKTAKVKPRSRDSRITHSHTLFRCHHSSVAAPWLSVMAEVNITTISLGRARRCSPPFVHVQSSAEKQWWNPDRLSVFWSVLFFFHAHPFLFFSPPCLPCITLSFSLPLSTGSLPASSFFRGMGAMDGHPSTQKLWKHSTRALVISNPSTAPCSITTTSSFLIVSLSPIQLDLSLSLPLLYHCLHVTVWQPKLSNQQILPK